MKARFYFLMAFLFGLMAAVASDLNMEHTQTLATVLMLLFGGIALIRMGDR